MPWISIEKLLKDGSIIRIAVNTRRAVNNTNKYLKVSKHKFNWLPSYGLHENFETYITLPPFQPSVRSETTVRTPKPGVLNGFWKFFEVFCQLLACFWRVYVDFIRFFIGF
jgi:hypothetical protein